MSWQELWERLEHKEVAPVYLLFGEEEYLIAATVAKIEAALELGGLRELNYERLEAAATTGARLAAAVQALPWLARRRLVVLTGLNLSGRGKESDTDSGAGEEGEPATGTAAGLEQELADLVPHLPASTCLVLAATGAVGGRRRVVKAVAKIGVVEEFPRLRGRELEAWIKARGVELGIKWEKGAVQLLAARTGEGLRQLEQELRKLATYAGQGGRVGRQEIELLVPATSAVRVFDLIDAALAGEEEKALKVLAHLLEQGETAIGLTALLARQVRLIVLAKEELEKGTRPDALAVKLKLHPFVAHKVAAQSRRFTWSGLYRLIQSLAAADQEMKTTGLNHQLILEQVLLGLAKGNE
ncbi:DNA polymerase III subunit delta [Gelria sp. Kuro-4]|uniref:DNA polymerase III subunit delta n=1 Tax=Gelria sp. Kuro-4 TaxID=2796927 RepID=UPI001BF0812B|nr:DNA polymerase III subunit delta [Gelria sp. Kuro-4]BCV24548.1 hypothetical protein kuro4_13210 [Gelria sp. Kuro-4]